MGRARVVRVGMIATAVGALLFGLLPSARADAPSVTTVEINQKAVRNGKAKGAVKDTLTAEGTAELPESVLPSPVADAGDSQYVEVGESVDLAGLVSGGTEPYEIAWSIDGDDSRFADPAVIEPTLSTDGLEPGPLVVTLDVTDANGRTGTDTVVLELYERFDRRVVDERVEVGPGVPDEIADPDGNADGQNGSFPFIVPDGTERLSLGLTWTTHEEILGGGDDVVVLNDFDLYVDDPSDAEDGNATGATTAMPETIEITAPAPGDWSALVSAFANTPDTYHLTADIAGRPASPLPTVTTPGPFRFELGQAQELAASVSGGVDPVALAWDLDLDGAFDDAVGPTAITAFGLGSNLVAVKVTDAAGHEAREVTAVRVVEVGSGDGQTPLVVVGVTDSGINLYHRDFRASTYADERVLELTGGFTRHPSEYIDGYPADARALPITLDDRYLPPEDAELFTRDNIAFNELLWVPGTKVVGAIDSGDSAAVNSDPDLIPILDEDSHGTRSASVAVGNIYGFCPQCLLVFVEGLAGDELLWDHPWIDITSNSFGSPGNVGAPLFFGASPKKTSAEGGQLQLYAAGNGNENAFITPQQTYTSTSLGPDWTINVGAAERGTRKPIVGTGKPVDITSWGSGTIPAADINTVTGTGNHSGTSAATPYTSGVFGDTLRQVRELLGDNSAGWDAGVVAQGRPVPGSVYLADGILSRAELQEVVFKSAEHDTGPNFAILPTTTPNNPLQYLVEGYGIAEPATTARAVAVLRGDAELPARAAEDEFFAYDEAIRDVLWGDWNGGRTATDAGEVQQTPRIDPVLTAGIVDQESAIALLGRLLAGSPTEQQLEAAGAAAAGTAESYFLHYEGPCDGSDADRAFMDQVNRTGDADGCGGAGAASIAGADVETFTADEVVDRTIPAGSKVNGTIYLQTAEPAAVTVTSTLTADGVPTGQGTSEIALSGGLVDVLSDVWVAAPFEFTTTSDLVPGAILSLGVRIDSSVSWFFGYEDDHASGFTIDVASGGGGGGGGVLAAAITAPSNGTVVDPAETPTLGVSGTYGLAAGEASVTRHYTRRDACGTAADNLRLSVENADGDSNGCSLVFQGLAPTGIAEFRETYPIDAGLPVTLGEGSVSGEVFVTGTGISPVHTVTIELLTADAAGFPVAIGSQTVSSTVVDVEGELGPTPFAFAFDVASDYVGVPLDVLTFDVVIEVSTGLFGIEHDDPATYVDLPLAGDADDGQVEVRVDGGEPTIAALGTDGTWAADVDVRGLAPGRHVISAVARQGESTSAPSTIEIVVAEDVEDPEPFTGVEVTYVPAGADPSTAMWMPAVDTSPDGDFSTWTFSANTTNLPTGGYDLHTRLVVDDVIVAEGDAVRFARK